MSGIKDYSDIINMSRWEPKKHPRMSARNRAFQFQPFDFSGQTDIDKNIARERLSETGDYEIGISFDENSNTGNK